MKNQNQNDENFAEAGYGGGRASAESTNPPARERGAVQRPPAKTPDEIAALEAELETLNGECDRALAAIPERFKALEQAIYRVGVLATQACREGDNELADVANSYQKRLYAIRCNTACLRRHDEALHAWCQAYDALQMAKGKPAHYGAEGRAP